MEPQGYSCTACFNRKPTPKSEVLPLLSLQPPHPAYIHWTLELISLWLPNVGVKKFVCCFQGGLLGWGFTQSTSPIPSSSQVQFFTQPQFLFASWIQSNLVDKFYTHPYTTPLHSLPVIPIMKTAANISPLLCQTVSKHFYRLELLEFPLTKLLSLSHLTDAHVES
jgi:hypothetical protein